MENQERLRSPPTKSRGRLETVTGALTLLFALPIWACVFIWVPLVLIFVWLVLTPWRLWLFFRSRMTGRNFGG